MNVLDYTDLTAAGLNFVLLAIIMHAVHRHGLWRSGMSLGIMAFFAIRVLARLTDAPQVSVLNGLQANLVLDVLAIGVLSYLISQARKFGRLMRVTLDEARFRAEEYSRAKRHYTQIVRHRMFNPLTAIEGSAHTLKSGVVDDQAIHDQLCDVILSMSAEMRDVSLAPERRDELEYDLDAVPRVPK